MNPRSVATTITMRNLTLFRGPSPVRAACKATCQSKSACKARAPSARRNSPRTPARRSRVSTTESPASTSQTVPCKPKPLSRAMAASASRRSSGRPHKSLKSYRSRGSGSGPHRRIVSRTKLCNHSSRAAPPPCPGARVASLARRSSRLRSESRRSGCTFLRKSTAASMAPSRSAKRLSG